tara:strand:+ start:195 stop:746 length:552 start_codon:yes stop_codon:yes gene_type:complete
MTSRLLVDKIEGKTTANTVQMPSGSIIQVVTNVPSSVSLITQSGVTSPTMSEVSTTYRTTITPKFSTSKLILELNFLFGGNNTSYISQFKFFDVTNNSNIQSITGEGSRTFNHASARHKDHDGNDRDNIHMKTVIDAGNTNARTYSLYAGKEGGATHYFNATTTDNSGCSFAPFCFTIMEVAQ